MSEAVVQRFEDELESEMAASMLRANGIDARVRFRATMGVPRPIAPLRVMAPSGEYELVVDPHNVDRAMELLEASGPPSARPGRYRWLGLIMLAAFVLPLLVNFVIAAIEQLR